MSVLLKLQEEFQRFLLTGQSDIDLSIVSTEKVGAETRLGVYKNAYKLRLIESLTVSYPGLYQYLGTEGFEKLAHAYIDANPSNYRSIRWYGDTLAEFIHGYYKKDFAYLAELAEFEWKMSLAFDAADEEVVRIEDMARVQPESWASLQFIAHPSIQRMSFFWNVVPIWQALIKEQDIPELIQQKEATGWVAWRAPDLVVQFYSLAPEEAWALDVTMQGLSFGELCEGLCQWVAVDEVGLRAASYLKNWIQKGMLAKLLIG